MRRRVRRPVADTAVYIGNVPKTVRISEFKAKVSFYGVVVVQYLSCLTLYEKVRQITLDIEMRTSYVMFFAVCRFGRVTYRRRA